MNVDFRKSSLPCFFIFSDLGCFLISPLYFPQPRYIILLVQEIKSQIRSWNRMDCFQLLKHLLLFFICLALFPQLDKENTVGESLAFNEKHLHYEENSPALHPDEVQFLPLSQLLDLFKMQKLKLVEQAEKIHASSGRNRHYRSKPTRSTAIKNQHESE